jgi:hypothetical protein
MLLGLGTPPILGDFDIIALCLIWENNSIASAGGRADRSSVKMAILAYRSPVFFDGDVLVSSMA